MNFDPKPPQTQPCQATAILASIFPKDEAQALGIIGDTKPKGILPALPGESGWCYLEVLGRDGRRWRLTLTSYVGKPHVRLQPWICSKLGGPWRPEAGNGVTFRLQDDFPALAEGLQRLQADASRFDPLKDGGPCEPSNGKPSPSRKG